MLFSLFCVTILYNQVPLILQSRLKDSFSHLSMKFNANSSEGLTFRSSPSLGSQALTAWASHNQTLTLLSCFCAVTRKKSRFVPPELKPRQLHFTLSYTHQKTISALFISINLTCDAERRAFFVCVSWQEDGSSSPPCPVWSHLMLHYC